jgi:hypothetical protein
MVWQENTAHHVYAHRILEAGVQIHDKGVRCSPKVCNLIGTVNKLVRFYDASLGQSLKRVCFTSLFVMDLPKQVSATMQYVN